MPEVDDHPNPKLGLPLIPVHDYTKLRYFRYRDTIMDRGYTNFLTHLHAGSTKIPLQKIQATLSHYLAHASPLPTPLAGTVVSSPLFLALSYQRLQTLSTAFRYALHVKYQFIEAELEERQSQSLGWGLLANVFSRGVITRIQQWVGAILKGLQGGHPILRLVCCCGILLGMEDLRVVVPKEGDDNHRRITFEGSTAKGNVEDEAVVALAESMDRYSYLEGDAGWEKEFRKIVDAEEGAFGDCIMSLPSHPPLVDALSLSLIMMSQCASLIPSDKLRAIPLQVRRKNIEIWLDTDGPNQTLSRLLASSIEATFQSGTYLSKLDASCTLAQDGTLSVSANSAHDIYLNECATKGGIACCRRCVNYSTGRHRQGEEWVGGITPRGLTSDEMTPEVQALSTNIWMTFKTMLFSVVMISKEVLREAVYVSPTLYQPSFDGSKNTAPSDLALLTLRSLYNLSFIIYEFGGVASLVSADQGGGFKELKETFYLALDNLTGQLLFDADDQFPGRRSQVEAWTREICAQIRATMPVQRCAGIFRHVLPDSLPPSRCSRFECGTLTRLRDNSKEIVSPRVSALDKRMSKSDGRPAESPYSGLGPLSPRQDSLCTGHNRATDTSLERRLIARLGVAHVSTVSNVYSRAQDLLATPHDIDPYPSANGHDMSERQSQKLATNIDTNIAVRLLPLYTTYLIESSRQGKLNVHQLRLAFSTVVRFASASVKATTTEEPTSTAEKYGLTWYCIEALLNAIRDLSEERTRSQSLGAYDDHRHRLHLMIISTIPFLPLDLLPRVLDEIRAIIIQGRKRHFDLGSTPARLADREARRKELNQALLSEILEGVGDLEKDFVMRWWYDNRHILEDDIRPGADHQRLGSARKKEVKNPMALYLVCRVPSAVQFKLFLTIRHLPEFLVVTR
ncbi:Peroxisomal biogenesis factor [Salix suchowensis]|nr:Peroxisomal biogenesis factor [Salix suchowensis]